MANARELTAETFRKMVTSVISTAVQSVYGSIEKYIDINMESAVASVKYERGN